MLYTLPGNWVRDVHERYGASSDDHESVDPCNRGNVQRYELTL